MKKLIILLAFTAFVTSCGNTSTEVIQANDSTVVDSSLVIVPIVATDSLCDTTQN